MEFLFDKFQKVDNPFENFLQGDPFSSWWPFVIAAVVGIVTTIRSYLGGPKCTSLVQVDGKIIIITGGCSGIGLATCIELANRGGNIIIGCPNEEQAQKTIKELEDKRIQRNALIKATKLDLSSFSSIKEFVSRLNSEVDKVDILINNAGIVFHPFERTVDGHEKHLQVNYLGHFLLTHLLLPKLNKSPDGRIINVSAVGHYCGTINMEDINLENDFTSNKAFAQSKLALVMMARHMSKLLRGTNIKINAMQPGIVRGTKHMRHSPFNQSIFMRVNMYPWLWLFAKNSEQGAQTIIYMAVGSDLANTTGQYFSNCAVKEPSEVAKDDILAAKLYERSCAWAGLQKQKNLSKNCINKL